MQSSYSSIRRRTVAALAALALFSASSPVLAQKDIYAEAIDLSGSRVECPCGVAFFAAMDLD